MTSRGVSIGHNPDQQATPPWLVRLDSCDSTNDWALERIDQLGHGVAVLTAQQSAGRGRSGKRWVALPGSTAVSFVVHMAQVRSTAVSWLSLAAGLATVHAIEDLCPGLSCQLKWPNDIYLNDAKLGGILCEARMRGDGLAVVIGIGINRDVSWTPAAQANLSWPATSLRAHGTAPSELALIDRIRDHLLQAVGLLRSGREHVIGTQIAERDWLLGQAIRVDHLHGSTVGSAAGIDDQGQLLILTGHGAPTAINAGTITILSQDRSQA